MIDPVIIDGAAIGFITWCLWFWWNSWGFHWRGFHKQRTWMATSMDEKWLQCYIGLRLFMFVVLGVSIGWLWP